MYMLNYTTFRKKKIGRNLCECGLDKDFLDTISRRTIHKRIFVWTLSKFKTSALPNILLREGKDNPETKRKYLQITHLIKDL